MKYAHDGHDEESNEFKGTNVIEHEIPVNNTRPIRRPQYRTPFALREEMRKQVLKRLDQAVIREVFPMVGPSDSRSETESRRETEIQILCGF